MPTYDYLCDGCSHKFELFQSMKDDAIKKCPECKKPKLRRLFGTGAALMFKGSGFYTTDYRSDSYKKAAKADSAAGKSADSSSKESSSKSGESSGSGSSGASCSGDASSCKKCND
jgi:putative FmdB family regulatory protein